MTRLRELVCRRPARFIPLPFPVVTYPGSLSNGYRWSWVSIAGTASRYAFTRAYVGLLAGYAPAAGRQPRPRARPQP